MVSLKTVLETEVEGQLKNLLINETSLNFLDLPASILQCQSPFGESMTFEKLTIPLISQACQEVTLKTVTRFCLSLPEVFGKCPKFVVR